MRNIFKSKKIISNAHLEHDLLDDSIEEGLSLMGIHKLSPLLPRFLGKESLLEIRNNVIPEDISSLFKYTTSNWQSLSPKDQGLIINDWIVFFKECFNEKSTDLTVLNIIPSADHELTREIQNSIIDYLQNIESESPFSTLKSIKFSTTSKTNFSERSEKILIKRLLNIMEIKLANDLFCNHRLVSNINAYCSTLENESLLPKQPSPVLAPLKLFLETIQNDPLFKISDYLTRELYTNKSLFPELPRLQKEALKLFSKFKMENDRPLPQSAIDSITDYDFKKFLEKLTRHHSKTFSYLGVSTFDERDVRFDAYELKMGKKDRYLIAVNDSANGRIFKFTSIQDALKFSGDHTTKNYKDHAKKWFGNKSYFKKALEIHDPNTFSSATDINIDTFLASHDPGDIAPSLSLKASRSFDSVSDDASLDGSELGVQSSLKPEKSSTTVISIYDEIIRESKGSFPDELEFLTKYTESCINHMTFLEPSDSDFERILFKTDNKNKRQLKLNFKLLTVSIDKLKERITPITVRSLIEEIDKVKHACSLDKDNPIAKLNLKLETDQLLIFSQLHSNEKAIIRTMVATRPVQQKPILNLSPTSSTKAHSETVLQPGKKSSPETKKQRDSLTKQLSPRKKQTRSEGFTLLPLMLVLDGVMSFLVTYLILSSNQTQPNESVHSLKKTGLFRPNEDVFPDTQTYESINTNNIDKLINTLSSGTNNEKKAAAYAIRSGAYPIHDIQNNEKINQGINDMIMSSDKYVREAGELTLPYISKETKNLKGTPYQAPEMEKIKWKTRKNIRNKSSVARSKKELTKHILSDNSSNQLSALNKIKSDDSLLAHCGEEKPLLDKIISLLLSENEQLKSISLQVLYTIAASGHAILSLGQNTVLIDNLMVLMDSDVDYFKNNAVYTIALLSNDLTVQNVFSSNDNLISKISYLLNDPNESCYRNGISIIGYLSIDTKHTFAENTYLMNGIRNGLNSNDIEIQKNAMIVINNLVEDNRSLPPLANNHQLIESLLEIIYKHKFEIPNLDPTDAILRLVAYSQSRKILLENQQFIEKLVHLVLASNGETSIRKIFSTLLFADQRIQKYAPIVQTTNSLLKEKIAFVLLKEITSTSIDVVPSLSLNELEGFEGVATHMSGMLSNMAATLFAKPTLSYDIFKTAELLEEALCLLINSSTREFRIAGYDVIYHIGLSRLSLYTLYSFDTLKSAICKSLRSKDNTLRYDTVKLLLRLSKEKEIHQIVLDSKNVIDTLASIFHKESGETKAMVLETFHVLVGDPFFAPKYLTQTIPSSDVGLILNILRLPEKNS
ncbi:hypothetical protein HOG98_06610 [bacterium]|jgi:hypothetical protein|nr:hypothetical protein [bacterium]